MSFKVDFIIHLKATLLGIQSIYIYIYNTLYITHNKYMVPNNRSFPSSSGKSLNYHVIPQVWGLSTLKIRSRWWDMIPPYTLWLYKALWRTKWQMQTLPRNIHMQLKRDEQSLTPDVPSSKNAPVPLFTNRLNYSVFLLQAIREVNMGDKAVIQILRNYHCFLLSL